MISFHILDSLPVWGLDPWFHGSDCEQPGAEAVVRSSLGPKRLPRRIPQRLPAAKKMLPMRRAQLIQNPCKVSAEIDEKRTQSDPTRIIV